MVPFGIVKFIAKTTLTLETVHRFGEMGPLGPLGPEKCCLADQNTFFGWLVVVPFDDGRSVIAFEPPSVALLNDFEISRYLLGLLDPKNQPRR